MSNTTIPHPKVTAKHLARKAVVYLHQSSDYHVQHNLESQRLQYALVDRAKALGFEDIEVIDTDFGASASVGSRASTKTRPRESGQRSNTMPRYPDGGNAL